MFSKIKNATRKVGLLGTMLSLLTFSVVLAASGDLDTNFNGNGLVITDVVPGRSDIANGIAIQPVDGKIVAVGYNFVPPSATQDFALARYNVDGSLDSGFNSTGVAITDFAGRDTGFDVAVQSDGKIIISGQVCAAPNTKGACDVALARYTTAGVLDTTFSTDGKVTTDYNLQGNGSKGGLAIQSNGKILVGGYMYNGKDNDFAVYRYKANGALDKKFSTDGKVNFGFGKGTQDYAEDIVLQSDGKILVVGETCDSTNANCDFAIARLNSNGTLDKTFSGDGKQKTNMGADDKAWALAIQSNGKIVAVGGKYTLTDSTFAVARYTKTGALDKTFSDNGKLTFSVIQNVDSYASDVLIQPDDKIVIVGNAGNTGFHDFALVRLDNAGVFDSTFSDDGLLTIDFGGDDFGLAVDIQPSDGNYILAGYTDDGAQKDFALTRVLP